MAGASTSVPTSTVVIIVAVTQASALIVVMGVAAMVSMLNLLLSMIFAVILTQLIRIQLIGISGSDEDVSPDNPLL